MAILFASTEEDPYVIVNAAQIFSTRDETDNTDFTRTDGAVNLSSTATLTATFTASDELWVVASISHTTVNINNDDPYLQLKDSGTGQVLLQLDADNGLYNMEYWNGAAFVEISSADLEIPISATLIRHTIYCKLDNSVGVFEWYMDDCLVARFTGDTILTAATTVDTLILASANTTDTGSLNSTVFSEVIVSEEPTWGLRLFANYATGDGTNTAWTGTFADIDEPGEANDADFITDDVNGDIETFANQNLSTEAAGMTPICLVTAFRGQNSGAGSANNIQHCVRSTSDFFSANVTGLGVTLAPFYTIWAQNPNGPTAWTSTTINAMEFGVRAQT
jgi:hypothetical protein